MRFVVLLLGAWYCCRHFLWARGKCAPVFHACAPVTNDARRKSETEIHELAAESEKDRVLSSGGEESPRGACLLKGGL